jgi:hypothetical protein
MISSSCNTPMFMVVRVQGSGFRKEDFTEP